MLTVGAVLFVLLLIGTPIGAALGGAVAAFILGDPFLTPVAIFRAFFNFLNKYSVMAIPMFIFAGFLMERTGLVEQLFGFAEAAVGWLPGGLGYATLLAAVIFAAISGSSVAMCAALGVIVIPEMRRRCYPTWFATGLVAGGGGVAILIPPSIPLILYGIVTDTSIVELFFAGFIPGLLLALGDTLAVFFCAWLAKLPRGPFSLRALVVKTWGALPGLIMPVIVLGGLYVGVFTPTEAAAAACGYAMLYGIVSRRGAFFKDLLPVTARALNLTAVVLFLVGCVGIFQFVAANQWWPQMLAETIIGWGLSPLGFLIGVMVLGLFLGCFLDAIAIIVLTAPILFPVALALGIDPIHFGILMTVVCEMGLVTPPVGLNLYTVSGVSGVPVPTVLRGSMPFWLNEFGILALLIVIPALSLWLPSVLFQPAFR